MKYLYFFIVAVYLAVTTVHAQEEIEMTVPAGWVATETGIAKGNNQLSIGSMIEFGEGGIRDYILTLSTQAVDGAEVVSVGEIKDGDAVLQVIRELDTQGSKARSTLFVCKQGRNKHRLLELYTEDVFAVIAGGRAAIEFCSQT